MQVLILLIAASLCLAGIFVAFCVVSIRDGQFDDLESPRWRLLFDGHAEISGGSEMETNQGAAVEAGAEAEIKSGSKG